MDKGAATAEGGTPAPRGVTSNYKHKSQAVEHITSQVIQPAALQIVQYPLTNFCTSLPVDGHLPPLSG